MTASRSHLQNGADSDISLAYAVHVHKAQGLTAQTSGILTGGWQTDREHAYVAVSRAREQTQIYTSREDLGEQGIDTGALERLAERIERSRAQDATIAKQTAAEHDGQAQPERGPRRVPTRRRPGYTVADEDGIVRDLRDRDTQRTENTTPRPLPQTTRNTERGPIDIRETNPSEIQITIIDHQDTQLAYSTLYDLKSHTGEPTYALFGGWETDTTLGYVATVQHQDHTQTLHHHRKPRRPKHRDRATRPHQPSHRTQPNTASEHPPGTEHPERKPRARA